MRIVIGEDSALFREGLARLLEDAGHEVVGEGRRRRRRWSPRWRPSEPDLAIIDVRMPPDLTDDGARAARELRDAHPELGIVLLSQHVETRHSVELVASGGFGYLLKDRVLRRRRLPRRAAPGGGRRVGPRPGGGRAGCSAAPQSSTRWPT